MQHSDASWLVSRLPSWSHHEQGQLMPPSASGMAYIPRAEQRGGTEVSFGKSNFNTRPYYLCAPHAGGVFLLLLLLTSCLFLLLEPDHS